MKTQQEYIDQGEQYILKTYNRFPVVLEKGEGVYLYDADHKKYLDFGAGIAVFALGYGNEAYNQALKDQIDKLIHTSNLYYNIPAVEAAKKIVDASVQLSPQTVQQRGPLRKAFFVCVQIMLEVRWEPIFP